MTKNNTPAPPKPAPPDGDEWEPHKISLRDLLGILRDVVAPDDPK